MLKILFIAPRYEGGIGGHAARVAEKLRDYGFEINLMHISSIPIKKLKNPSFALFSTLKAIFGKEEYDVVHAFNIPSAFAMKYAKSKKKVLSVHGMYSEQVGILHSKTIGSVAKVVESKVLTWADKLTTDSKTVQKQYKEKLDVDFECIYAPLDVQKFKNLPKVVKKEKQIIYIGRDSYEKGIDVLKQIESNLNGNVVYCTNESWEDAMIKLKESSLIVIPSRMESIPQVIKEAFYLKVPIIATRVGGIPELITDGGNGILVSSNNNGELIDAINHLLTDKETVEKFTQNGYDFVMKNLTWDTLLQKYVQFYEDLMKS